MRKRFSRRGLLGLLAGLFGAWLGRARSAPAAPPRPAPAPPASKPPALFPGACRGKASIWTSYAGPLHGPPNPGRYTAIEYVYDARGRLIREGPARGGDPPGAADGRR